MLPIERLSFKSNRGLISFRLFFLAAFFVALASTSSHAKTCTFNTKIIASNNPFGSCPIGTDTILIRDTFVVDINYEPIIGGLPFDGKLIVDGGVVFWSSNVSLKLGTNARILLYHGGHLYPGITGSMGCNGLKTIFFDAFKLASCDGTNALHSFYDVNAAGCFDGTGICCDAAMTITDNSGNPDDRTLCQPGDSVTLSVVGSGSLNYDYLWSPNIGPKQGPYTVAQFVNTTYTISITGIFDPSGPAPAYLLTCGASAQVKINPSINLSTSVTPVPCAASAVGAINLTATGGTPPYKYLWSNGKTTEDINTLTGGNYTVTVTDARSCTSSKVTTVFTLDNTPPVISCPASANGVAVFNQCTTTIPGIDATFSDNCPSAQLSYVISGATTATGNGQLSNTFPFHVGLNNVQYKVSDGTNEVSCFFNVTVADNQFPTASNPAPLNGIQCAADVPAPNPAVVTDEADNCGTPTVSYLSQSTLGGSSCPGDPLVISRKYRITDASGNGITVTQLINVADNTPPVFSLVPANVTVNCQSVPNPGTATASDNCTASPVVTYLGQTRVNGPCLNTYSLIRTWKAEDNCGNTSTASQTITVQDITAPVFSTVPANVTVNCQSIPAVGSPTATDNCDASVNISYLGETKINGACPGSYTLNRTWRATDNCGNSSTAQQQITVQDLSSPTFTFVPANVTVSCESVPIVGLPTASDNCDPLVSIVYQGETRTDGPCQDTYTLLRTWKAQDNCGNTSTASQLITVRDLTAPTFTSVPANVTSSCESIPPVGNPAATDNCDASVSIVYNGETRTNGSCLFTYTLKRQWTATDNCGNTKTATQTITIQDLTKPVFSSVPPNITVSCESIPSVGTPVATDNCDPSVSITYTGETRQNGACLDSYLLLRNWIATDQCGNTATAQQTITVHDVTPPVYTFVPDAVTVNCQSVPAVGTPTATDNCDASVSITFNGETRTNGNCPNNYTLSRTWTATDNCGNTTLATQIITVQDITAPVFTAVPGPVTASCESLPPVGMPTATDNCTPNVTITYLGESIPGNGGACPGNYIIVRTWSAQDACSNSTTASQMITVQDITPPVVVSVPADIVVSCDNIPAVGIPTATDNCDASPTITYTGATRINGACPNSYTLKRNWTITDDCGNTSTAVQTLSVEDTTPPVFTFVPGPITVNCDLVPHVGSPTATDNCASSVLISYIGDTRTNGPCPDSYTLTRSWKAADSCGNTAIATQLITVQDTTRPKFTFIPVAITVSCDNIPGPGTPTATDNCDNSVTIQYNGDLRIDGNCPSNYTLQRTWTATDNCGNTALGTQMITVQDITVPVFTSVPGPMTASCDALPPVGTPLATDNCTPNVFISFLGESVPGNGGSCPGNYAIVRTWSAMDACGNTATATQTINVQDITPPVVVTVPANIVVSCDNIPPVGTPTATDNCDSSPSVTYTGATRINGACANSYTLQRHWTITDDCGNTSTAVQTLTVQDITAPVFTSVPAAITVSCESIPPVGQPVASDNCAASVQITYNGATRVDGPCPDTYTLNRTWTAVDSCGNTSTALQVITVQDITAPTFTFVPVPVTVNCDAIPPIGTPTATDNCDAAVSIQFVEEVRTNGNCPNNYTLSRTWKATDNCGNTSLATQVITVRDITAPVFTFVPAAETVNCNAIPMPGVPTATDNCTASVAITYLGEAHANGNCPGNYTLTRVWAAQDQCGNTALGSQVITVQDITKPVVTFVPADVTVSCSAIPPVGTPVATDNCDPDPAVTYTGATRVNGGCPNSYTLTRHWTISDACGNTSTAHQVITVEDITPPVFTAVPAGVTASCESIPPVETPTAADNCAASVSITYNGVVRTDGACPDTYTLTRTWTARDSCGNTATAQQIIQVKDITAPNFTFLPPDLTVPCDGIPPVAFPTAADNCDAFVNITYAGQTRIDGACPHSYFLRREWIATDNCSNTSSATQVITVQDLTAPTFTAVPANVTVSCDAVPTVGTPEATDNCTANVAISYIGETRTNGNCPNNYSLKRTWSAMDDCGNTKTAFQIITVQDLTKPVFSFVPADSTVNCNAIPAPGVPLASDNCTANPTIVYVGETIMSSNSPDSYTLQRKWTATDECNNTATALQMLTVQDTIAPQIQCPTNMTMDGDPATCAAIAVFDPPITSDNCSASLTITSSATTGQAFPVGTTLVTMVVSDPTGNESTCSFKITVLDKTPPVLLNCPSDFTVTTAVTSCDALVNWTAPTVTDPCDLYPIPLSVSTPNGSVLPTGIHTITYTAVDSSGNSSQCSFAVTVREDVPPVLTNCPPNLTAFTNSCNAIVNWNTPNATDNCALDTLVVSTESGSVFPETNTLVQYTATDLWGNTATCSFMVTVIDTVPPQFAGCPESFVVNAGLCQVPVTWVLPAATDNCTTDPTIYSVPASGSILPSGFTTVHIFVVDPSGNQDTCTFVVEVIGPPIGLSNLPVDQSFVGCQAVATWNPPVPTGICGPYTLSSNHQPGETFPIGTTQVVYTLADTLNHVVTTTFNITVTESIPPQFICPVSPIKVNIGALVLNDPSGFITGIDTVYGCNSVDLQFLNPVATDNCGIPTVTQSGGQQTGTVFALGAHTLSFEAKDAAGNTALCSVQLEVLPLLPLNPQVSDAIGCKGDEITLSATVIPGAHYFWTGPLAPYPDDNNLIIPELDGPLTGYYTVVADVNGCITPLDSARVRMGVTPDAVDDLNYQIGTNETLVDFNVLLNDAYELDDYTLQVQDPITGLINHGFGVFSFEAGNKNTVNYFIYTLCSKACPDLCDEGIVAINVRERICSYIPNIITPNGDDMNDYLIIPCLDIEPYPQNQLVIYNQWGDRVYEAAPYLNDPDHAWRGDLFGKYGRPLPDATYFYIFKATPEDKGLNGFIEVHR